MGENSLKILDTTLRDGSQMEGVSFSVSDKIKIAHVLDEFGANYIEGGFPGSNEKEKEFFKKIEKETFSNSEIIAFGCTRHKSNKPENDFSLNSILESGVRTCVIFGKCWDFHVEDILKISLDENLEIIDSSVEYLTKNKIKVFFDAEHFFDGFLSNEEYALRCLNVAEKAGAKNLSLCDTNGGMIPIDVSKIVKKVKEKTSTPLGIHAHNDTGCATANTISAINAGAELIHLTVNGYGERSGNANICVVAPNVELKLNYHFSPGVHLEKLRYLSLFVSEIANLPEDKRMPYVGNNAFTHKAGIHVSAIEKDSKAYEHIDPSLVGNDTKITVSELSGRSNIIRKAKEFGFNISENQEKVKEILKLVKDNERNGFYYEGADASLYLLTKKAIGGTNPPFEILDFLIVNETGRRNKEMLAEATVKVKVDKRTEHTVSSGKGPVNALDQALRKALIPFYPIVKKIKLTDYKVRIIGGVSGTGAATRVLIDSQLNNKKFSTIGASENIIEASFLALVDAYSYGIISRD